MCTMMKLDKLNGKFMEKLLTINEVSEYFQISKKTIYNHRNYGLPFIKLGKKTIRYNLNAVSKWFEEYNKKSKKIDINRKYK